MADPNPVPDAALTVAGLAGWLTRYAELITEHEGELTSLDSAIGDGDHGANMVRGMRAVATVLQDQSFETLDALAKKVGMTLVSTVGGASGPLYGTLWLRFATALAGRAEATPTELGAALRAGTDGVRQRGKAEPNDKTMLDALLPALDAFDAAVAADAPLARALADAAAAADSGCAATIPLVARKGRASYLGERSAGHQDPGATSAALLFRAAAG
ncbi:MAG: dihydroxyacetone kinase subunit DhaL [Actinomycetes bacterium]